MFPHSDLSHAQNASRLAPFALAGYYDDPIAHVVQRKALEKRIEDEDGSVWFEKRANAHVVIVVHGRDIIIGIAGTNDGKDFRQDLDVQPMRFGDLSDIHNVPVALDASECRTTRGFASHAILVYRAITTWAQREGYDNWEFDRIWITGHSLGGSIAFLLQYFVPFGDAAAYTFGAARCLRKHSVSPSRLRTRIIDVSDSIIYQPAAICRHPESIKLYLAANGSLTASIPKHYLPAYAAIVAVLWSLGIIGSIVSVAKIPWPWVMFRGHSMDRYAKRMAAWI